MYVPVPVISYEAWIWDDLELTGLFPTYDYTRIVRDDSIHSIEFISDHQIAAGLSGEKPDIHFQHINNQGSYKIVKN